MMSICRDIGEKVPACHVTILLSCYNIFVMNINVHDKKISLRPSAKCKVMTMKTYKADLVS